MTFKTAKEINNIPMSEAEYYLKTFMNSIAKELQLDFIFEEYNTEDTRTGEISTKYFFRGVCKRDEELKAAGMDTRDAASAAWNTRDAASAAWNTRDATRQAQIDKLIEMIGELT